MKHYTYLYRDPKDGRPIYVGKGQGNRAFAHKRAKSRDGRLTYLANLIRKRVKEGYLVLPIISYEVDEQAALEMEKFWIKFYGRADLGLGTLLNLTDGGDGACGAKRSPETIAKMSGRPAHNRGKKQSEETKQKYIGRVPWNKGIPMREESKQKWIGKVPWNKGLTAATDERLAAAGAAISQTKARRKEV